MSERLRWVLGACLALLVAWAGMARAAPSDEVALGDEPYLDLAPALRFHIDEGGTLEIDQIARSPQLFQPRIRHGFGYHPGRVWARFDLSNPGLRYQRRWLSVDWALQERVTLYLVDAEGVLVATSRSGTALALEERALPAREVLFPVELGPGERRTAYLSFSGRAATVVDLSLWDPAHFLDSEQRHAALKYLAIGTTALTIFFCALAARVRGAPVLWLGAGAQFFLILVVMGSDGYGIGLLPAGDGLWQNRAMQITGCLYITCQLLFARTFLSLPTRLPAAARLLEGTALLALLVALAPFFVIAPVLGAWTAPVCLALLTGVAGYAALHGDRTARLYLASWALLWVGVLIRMAGGFGLLPLFSLANDTPVIAQLVSSLVLSYAIYENMRSLMRRNEAVQRRMLRLQRNEGVRLKLAVEERTRELSDAVARAEQASTEKSGFLSTMAHELRAPLHAVLGYTHLLQRESTGSGRDRLDLIDRNGAKLLQLIDQALTYSRGEAVAVELEPGPVVLRPLLGQLVTDNQPAATQQNNRLVLNVRDAVPACVEGDEQRLLQVLQNLVGNACKYTSDGVIELHVEAVQMADTAHPTHQARTPTPPGGAGTGLRATHRLRFSVRDQGPGIAPEQQVRVFEPFNRLPSTRHQPGVGLGLTIARQLMRAMGGDIQLVSHPGEGCCFSFELDLPERAAPIDAAAALRWTAHPAPEAAALPPAEALAPLKEMLALGQVVTIGRWILAFQQQHPEWTDFLLAAHQCCEAVDLPGLERLLAATGVARVTLPGASEPSRPAQITAA